MSNPQQYRRSGRPGAFATIALLGIFIIAAFVIGNTVFAVRTIVVEGNNAIADQEVIAASGISPGDSMFSIDTLAVRDGINANRYLRYQSLWRDFPNRIILRVSEHSPHATLTFMGMLVMLDSEGAVLDQTAQIEIELDVPMVTGMQVDAVRIGEPIVSTISGQTQAVASVLDELSAQNVTGQISELNVASLDNLYLITIDGLQVMLGDVHQLREKINIMNGFLQSERMHMALSGCVLDVSTGINADFRSNVKVPEESDEPTDGEGEEGDMQDETGTQTH